LPGFARRCVKQRIRLNTSFLRAVTYLTVLALAGCGEDAPADEDMTVDESATGSKDKDAGSSASSDGSKPADAAREASRPVEDGSATPDGLGHADGGRDASRPPADAALPGRPDGSTPSMPVGDGGSGLGDIESLRKLCVDEINMYRATISLPPLARAADQESCSDDGAKLDGDTGKAHGSAGKCKGLGGQNTCPGWGVGPRTGNATLADALKKCLKMMWDEAEPPVSRMECQMDYQGCFLKHGHYLNMSDTRYKRVACGFYQMADGKYWMNQNFGS